MKRAISLFIVMLAVGMADQPPAVWSAESQSVWRERESQGSGIVPDDIQEEISFGREVAARILGRYGLFENSDANRYVNLVGRSVVQNVGRPEIEFRFSILKTDEINAYAAPGGYVFVTRGALLRMQDESELAAVLAHELAHVSLRHIVKELNIHATDTSPTSGLAKMIGGSTEAARAAFTQLTEGALNILFTTGYKRADEIQADKTGLMYTALSGYDPRALGRYLDRISSAKVAASQVLDKTHPSYSERIAWLNATIEEQEMVASPARAPKERFAELGKNLK